MRQLLHRLLSTVSRPPPNENMHPLAAVDWQELLASQQASRLRDRIKRSFTSGQNIAVADLLERAKAFGWNRIEMEKLAAYCEFYSGHSAAGYQRVMANGLARTDYPLFMTACVHCYLFDRYGEGLALLEQFDPAGAHELDLKEFLAYAGYITFAGGGPIEDATGYFDQALNQGLISPLLVVNAYPIYFEAGKHERVDQLRALIQERYASDPEALFAVACSELARGYYPEGFRLAEARYLMPEAGRSINPSLFPRQRWRGEDLKGKRLLVHGEQGYGDLVMMARYLPMLTSCGAEVVLDCRAAADSLMQYNHPNCEIITGDITQPISATFDYWTGIMSLPFHFDTTVDSVPATAGYLRPPPEPKLYWHTRVRELTPCATLRIGLAWSGNPGHRADKRRSIAFERISSYIASHRKMSFFALQTSVPIDRPANLFDVSEEMVTLADTAALIEEMDLVITVDTSAAHLAGALGKRTWLLLPYRYEWRWGLAGENNAWYASVQVLRQQAHGDWDTLLDSVFHKRLPLWTQARHENAN